MIKLMVCNHGNIVFERRIIFNGYSKENIADLIKKLKGSDYQKKHKLQDSVWELYLKPRSIWSF